MLGEGTSKPRWDIAKYSLEWLKFKRLMMPAVGKEVGPLELPYNAHGDAKVSAILSNGLESPVKWNMPSAHNPAILPQGIAGRNGSICLHETLYSLIYDSSIHKNQKLEIIQCPSTGEWMKKLWYMLMMGYYSTIQRKKLLICSRAWADLQNTFSGRSVQLHLYEILEKAKV